MKFVVDEMPFYAEECPFFELGVCRCSLSEEKCSRTPFQKYSLDEPCEYLIPLSKLLDNKEV